MKNQNERSIYLGHLIEQLTRPEIKEQVYAEARSGLSLIEKVMSAPDLTPEFYKKYIHARY
jgi:hypothetical protein